MVLPVKVKFGDNNAFVHTMDISFTGARLGGFREQLQPGTTLNLTRGAQRAKFRIVWVQQIGDREFHAGIEALEPQEKFWGVDLSAQDRDNKKSVEALMSLLNGDKRR